MRGLARGHVDVAIIGTGLTSLSAALYLARKNAMAQVFEKRRGQIRRVGPRRRHGHTEKFLVSGWNWNE
ncbi:NAD(P)-binding protein [Streptomyces europaeiscabiei]|uniref:NAD(P)-binding protein n=1 Tax=Streptomyces europaeiscabiei TaxID=146819 RepID=UPI0038D3BAAF